MGARRLNPSLGKAPNLSLSREEDFWTGVKYRRRSWLEVCRLTGGSGTPPDEDPGPALRMTHRSLNTGAHPDWDPHGQGPSRGSTHRSLKSLPKGISISREIASMPVVVG